MKANYIIYLLQQLKNEASLILAHQWDIDIVIEFVKDSCEEDLKKYPVFTCKDGHIQPDTKPDKCKDCGCKVAEAAL